MGKILVTSIPAWQNVVDFLALDSPFGSKLVVKLNTGCVQNVVTTECCSLGRPRLGTDVEDLFFQEPVTCPCLKSML
jgi:hypothetical protein